jgi:hypothetical protein
MCGFTWHKLSKTGTKAHFGTRHYTRSNTLGAWVVKRGWRHYLDLKSRRDKSYFRLGLDWVDRCFRLDDPVPLRFILYF